MYGGYDPQNAGVLDRRYPHKGFGGATQFFIAPRPKRLKWLEANFKAQKKALIMLHYAWASPGEVSQLSDEMTEFLVDVLVWSKRIEVT